MEEVKKQGMESLFVPYKIALALKELGFDYQCVNYYSHYGNGQVHLNNLVLCSKIGVETNNDKGILAPLYQQAFRWLYQKLDIEKGVMPLDTESQQLLLKELIDKVSSKHLLV